MEVNSTPGTFPKVTWNEVMQHFIRELRIDSEWMYIPDNEEVLSWWPGFLRQDIRADASGDYDPNSTDNWIRVTVSTKIAKTDAENATRLVGEYAEYFSLGGLFHRDGIIELSTSLMLNPLCRDLLHWLHNAALIQATVAHELAGEWLDTPNIDILVTQHPLNGTRWQPDELLQIFGGSDFTLDLGSLDDVLTEGVRSFYKSALLRDCQEGFANDEVDFFNRPTFDLAIGRKPVDNPWGRKFGDGLHVIVSVTGNSLPNELVNSINADIASTLHYSQLGNVQDSSRDPYGVIRLNAFIPHLALAKWATDPVRVGTNILNFALHCAGTIAQFQRDYFGVPPEAQTWQAPQAE